MLVVGREGNARYVSGAPRLWTAGSRAFGPGCVLVRRRAPSICSARGTKGSPTTSPTSTSTGSRSMRRTSSRRSSGSKAPRPPGPLRPTPSRRRQRSFSRPRSRRPSSSMASRCYAGFAASRRPRRSMPSGYRSAWPNAHWARRWGALAPGVTERQLTGVFMEAMASAGVTTPATQDVAWITSRRDPWHRVSRDEAVEPGDLVAFDAGVILGGYYRRARSDPCGGRRRRHRPWAVPELGRAVGSAPGCVPPGRAADRAPGTRTRPRAYRRPPCRSPGDWGSGSTFHSRRMRSPDGRGSSISSWAWWWPSPPMSGRRASAPYYRQEPVAVTATESDS